MFLSPFILGIIFVTLTQVSFAASVNVSSSLINVSSSVNSFKFPFYQTNFYTQCPSGLGVLNPGSWMQCIEYGVFDSVYGVGFQAVIFNSVVSIMTSTWGSLPLFMLLYYLAILILEIYSFSKIDWYSLQYLSSLETGELEAKNYNKLKNTYIQYIAFLFSPVLFVIAIILLNAFVTAMISIISFSQLSLIPP